MGKVLDSLKGISLPSDVESTIRILDVQFEQMEITMKAFDQGRENMPVKGPTPPGNTDATEDRVAFASRLAIRPLIST